MAATPPEGPHPPPPPPPPHPPQPAGTQAGRPAAGGGGFLTARLQVEPADDSSGPALQRLLAEPRVAASYFIETAAAAAAAAACWDWRGPPESVTLAARWRASGAVVAGVRLEQDRISYFVDAACWRQGVGHELLDEVIRRHEAVPGHRALEAIVDRGNASSRRLLERLGFAPCGIDRAATRQSAGRTVLRYRRAPGAATARAPGLE